MAKIAVFMNEIDTLSLIQDSTLLMIHRALELGHECVYFTLQNLWCANNKVYANVSSIQVNPKLFNAADSELRHYSDWITTQDLGCQDLSNFDIILIRLDPPFDAEYIYATYMLELLEHQGVIVSNKPQSLRDANEKMFTLWFPKCCPATMVSCNIKLLHNFWVENQHVIFKPLNGMGGMGVCEIGPDGHNINVILELLTQRQTTKIMAQTYIPEIRCSGDKRIIMIHGEPVPYGLARIPALGDVRGNLCAGATSKIVPITDRDHWLCAQVSPTLKNKGLDLVGLDVIGDYITEINVTSPSCMRDIVKYTGLDVIGDYFARMRDE